MPIRALFGCPVSANSRSSVKGLGALVDGMSMLSALAEVEASTCAVTNAGMRVFFIHSRYLWLVIHEKTDELVVNGREACPG